MPRLVLEFRFFFFFSGLEFRVGRLQLSSLGSGFVVSTALHGFMCDGFHGNSFISAFGMRKCKISRAVSQYHIIFFWGGEGGVGGSFK